MHISLTSYCCQVSRCVKVAPTRTIRPSRYIQVCPFAFTSFSLYRELIQFTKFASVRERKRSFFYVAEVKRRRNKPALGRVVRIVKICRCLHAILLCLLPNISKRVFFYVINRPIALTLREIDSIYFCRIYRYNRFGTSVTRRINLNLSNLSVVTGEYLKYIHITCCLVISSDFILICAFCTGSCLADSRITNKDILYRRTGSCFSTSNYNLGSVPVKSRQSQCRILLTQHEVTICVEVILVCSSQRNSVCSVVKLRSRARSTTSTFRKSPSICREVESNHQCVTCHHTSCKEDSSNKSEKFLHD